MRGPKPGRNVPSATILFFFYLHISFSQSFIGQGEILLSHISPAFAQASDEFIVLYNPSSDTVDLNGYEVKYFTSSGSPGSAGRSFTELTPLPPKSHLLLSNRDTVRVGSVTVVRDHSLASGMAASGGQLVLRWSAETDSIVFAVAWGNVTQFVSGMTEAALWEGEGMLFLAWQDSSYERASYNMSNFEYSHVGSDSIESIPSLSPGRTVQSVVGWSIGLTVIQGDRRDSSVLIGMDESATDGFDSLLDLPKPPPPADDHITAGIMRSDLQLATGDYLTRDVRKLGSLSDTTTEWSIDIFPVQSGISITLQLGIHGLSHGLPVHMHNLQADDRTIRNGDFLEYSFVPGSTDPQRFRIVVGDTTSPVVEFKSPIPDEAYVVATPIELSLDIHERSGVEFMLVEFRDLVGTSEVLPVYAGDTLRKISWMSPRRLITDSAEFQVFIQDSMGNAGRYSTRPFRIVPDTVSFTLSPGWTMMSVPLDPMWASIDSVIPSARKDSLYAFRYSESGGYILTDSVISGLGYFVGSIRARNISVPGRPVVDSLSVFLPPGYSMIGNPTSRTIALQDLTVIRDNAPYTYAAALSSSILANGLFGYDEGSGSYIPSDSIRPWRGYWLPVLESDVLIRFPDTFDRPLLKENQSSEEGWEIRFRVETGGVVDTLLSIGVHPDATAGFDARFDTPAPPIPPVGQPITAIIEHPEWRSSAGTRFLSDVRKAGSSTEWIFVVRTAVVGEVRMRWEGSRGELPDAIFIKDLTSAGEIMLLNDQWSYEFDSSREQRFSITSALTQVGSKDIIPRSFGVEQNYPNPFNGTTSLIIFIPERGKATLKVYDMRGRLVDIITEGTYEPGRYTLQWDTPLSSGVYLGEALFRPDHKPRSPERVALRMMLLK